MEIRELNRWDVTPKEAVGIQRELLVRRRLGPPLPLNRVGLVAGADVSMNRKSPEVYAAVVVLSLPELEVVEVREHVDEAVFPYVPGLLSFREIPVLLTPFERLTSKPDVVLVDGHGVSHPRGLGIATHLGLVLEAPTIGCAKTLLTGGYQEPGRRAGATTPLLDKQGLQIGKVVRTRTGVAPIFVSVGNMIDIDSAVNIVMACVGKYRLPEPSRQAHIEANRLRTSLENLGSG